MSLAGTIGSTIVTAIQGLGLTLGGAALPANSVVRRKTPSVPEGKSLPQVVVVVGETPETERIDAFTKLNRWQVAVVIVSAAGGSTLADDDSVRTAREQIVAAVFDKQLKTFARLSGFNEVKTTGRSPFDPAALAKDYNYSTINFEVQTLEPLAT